MKLVFILTLLIPFCLFAQDDSPIYAITSYQAGTVGVNKASFENATKHGTILHSVSLSIGYRSTHGMTVGVGGALYTTGQGNIIPLFAEGGVVKPNFPFILGRAGIALSKYTSVDFSSNGSGLYLHLRVGYAIRFREVYAAMPFVGFTHFDTKSSFDFLGQRFSTEGQLQSASLGLMLTIL